MSGIMGQTAATKENGRSENSAHQALWAWSLSKYNLAGAARWCVDARRRAPSHDIATVLIGTACIGVGGNCPSHAGRATTARGAVRASTTTSSVPIAEGDRRAAARRCTDTRALPAQDGIATILRNVPNASTHGTTRRQRLTRQFSHGRRRGVAVDGC